ncbi:MAG: hypothetical protein H6551_02390 [Chitinophagales bacterium]|nr:hypothetical protein [Chitinophagales bacterium]
MKKLLKLMVPVVALAIGFASCDKATTTTTPTTTTPTPTTPTAPTPVTPNLGNFWGVMAAIQMEFSYSNAQVPFPVTISSDVAVASFYNSGTGGGSMVDAGSVSVNGNSMNKQTNNSYLNDPMKLDLGFSNGAVDWSVAGGNGIPAISYSHTGSFPAYSGTLPTSIDKSKDLDIDLGSKVSGADSVYVVIVTSSETIIKRYKGNPAPSKATITASEMSNLPTVSDNTAYLEIVPFTYKMPNVGGKQFVAIKEAAVVSGVNIN